jgi:hypothetical protein
MPGIAISQEWAGSGAIRIDARDAKMYWLNGPQYG